MMTNPPLRRSWTTALAVLLVLVIGGSAWAENYPMLADDPADFFPVMPAMMAPPQALGEISGGLYIEYTSQAADHVIEMMLQDAPRVTAFIQYQATGVIAIGASLGFRLVDVESSEVNVGFGEVIEVPLLVFAKITPTQPLFGTGRTKDEITIEPFVTVAAGLYLYDYDSDGPKDLSSYGGVPGVEIRSFGNSFGAEARIGMQARIPPGITLGLSVGYFWTVPSVRVLPVDDSQHFNAGAYTVALHGQLHVF